MDWQTKKDVTGVSWLNVRGRRSFIFKKSKEAWSIEEGRLVKEKNKHPYITARSGGPAIKLSLARAIPQYLKGKGKERNVERERGGGGENLGIKRGA